MSSSAQGLKTFEYAVRDRQGKVVKGRVEAANQVAVANRLKEMGMAALAINEVSTRGLQTEISIPGLTDRISLKDLAIMSRQLATMIDAGLSLLRALSILAEQTDSKPLAKVLATVRGDVEVGLALSVALAKHDKVFPPLMIHLVQAGEVGGFLDRSLLSIADNFEAEVKLRGKVKSAMTYPVIVFVIAILAATGMLLFIVPVFSSMFTSLGGQLPFLTRVMVVASQIVKVTIIPVIVLLVAGAAWWARNKNKRSVREKIDPLKLKAPVFGPLFKKIAISRFTRNLGTMLSSGVPLLQALEIVGDTSGNTVIEHATREVQSSVRKGESLAGPLAAQPVFPPMVVQMMAVGEDTGALDTMLSKVADFYDEEVEATTEALTSLIEPLMIVVIGAIIGTMVIGLYMPIFQIFNLIK